MWWMLEAALRVFFWKGCHLTAPCVIWNKGGMRRSHPGHPSHPSTEESVSSLTTAAVLGFSPACATKTCWPVKGSLRTSLWEWGAGSQQDQVLCQPRRPSALTWLPFWLGEELQEEAAEFSVDTGAEYIWQNPKGCVKDSGADTATPVPSGQPTKVCHLLSFEQQWLPTV